MLKENCHPQKKKKNRKYNFLKRDKIGQRDGVSKSNPTINAL